MRGPVTAGRGSPPARPGQGWQPQTARDGDPALSHRKVGGAVGQYFCPIPRSIGPLDKLYMQQRECSIMYLYTEFCGIPQLLKPCSPWPAHSSGTREITKAFDLYSY